MDQGQERIILEMKNLSSKVCVNVHLLRVAIVEGNVMISLPKAFVILDTTWYCPRIGAAASRKFDEDSICNPPVIGTEDDISIDAAKKQLLTVIQLVLLKSAGCNITMVRASGFIAKNALKLEEEILDVATPVNFWRSNSELIARNVSPSCRFVVTSHISFVLRNFPLVCCPVF